jgi:hypothetical protein
MLLDVARKDPNHDAGELVDRLHAVNTRAIDLTEALLLLSRVDQRSFTRAHVDLSLIAEEATETLLPFAEEHGVTIETSGEMTPTIGSHALLLQLTTNLVHNAIVHNLPEEGTVWVTTGVRPTSVVLTVENTGQKLTPQLVATLVINDAEVSPVDQIMELTGGMGADRGCECVGYQAHDPQGQEHNNITLNNLVKSVKFTGTIGVVGDDLAKEGETVFDYGMFWFRGQTMGTGQCNVKNYNRQLMRLIETDKAEPSWVVSHELALDEAPDGYAHFDRRDDGWTKVVLHPDGSR